MQAPKRRIDNVITDLYDSTSLMILYSKIWNDVISRFVLRWRSCRLQEAGWTLAGGAGFSGLNYLSMDPMLQGGALGGSILSIGALFWYHQTYLQRMQDDLTSTEALSASFQRTHASSGSLPTVSEGELQRLQ